MKLSLLIVALFCVHAQGKGLRQECPRPTCKPVPKGCNHLKLSGMKNPKTGCLMFPCGLTKCPKPQPPKCPTPRCPKIPENCAWSKINMKTTSGCPRFPCGIVKCKKPRCPTPMCAPAKNGCMYEKSDACST